MIDRPYVNPLLKWIGGKRWLVPSLIPYFQQSRRLIDPFVGGMAIPLGLRADKAVISDINPHLINLYQWLQRGISNSTGLVDFTNSETVYYKNRDWFNKYCAEQNYWTQESALLFYYLNRTCFNGLCRFNQAGIFNAAYGKYKKLEYKESFLDYREVLAGWEILHGDFQQIQLRPDDFIYADPPYDDTFTKFTKEDFSWQDQERLANWLAQHPGPVIASNSYTDRIHDLYRRLGFQVYIGKAPRRVSCDGDRTPAQEVLCLKNI